MYKLLQKNEPWVWLEPQINAFNTLKDHLFEYPILRPPNFHRKFLLFTDASNHAIVVMYGSRTLKGAVIHYGITEKECLAVVWAVKQCRVYIYGMTTTIVTDHSALKWLLNIPEPIGLY